MKLLIEHEGRELLYFDSRSSLVTQEAIGREVAFAALMKAFAILADIDVGDDMDDADRHPCQIIPLGKSPA